MNFAPGATLKRFVEFARQENPRVKELTQVTRRLAHLFMEGEAPRGVCAKKVTRVIRGTG